MISQELAKEMLEALEYFQRIRNGEAKETDTRVFSEIVNELILKAGKRIMREIKFRAWDNVCLCMFSPSDSKNMWRIKDSYNGIIEYPDGILMQFTGLKDRTGKEIYEGDILKTPLAAWVNEFNYTYVEYRDEIASYIKRTSDNSGFVRLEIRINEVEVVGNIYETPELLRKEGSNE